MNLKTKVLVFFGVIGIFLVVVLYVLEFQWIQNSIGFKKLLIGALVYGLVNGVGLGLYYQKNGNDWVDKAQIWTASIAISLLLMPLLASMVNRFFAGKAQLTKAIFWEEKAYITSRFGKFQAMSTDTTGFFLFVLKDGAIQRLSAEHALFPNAVKGDTIELPIREGLFGVEIVDFGKNQD